MKYKWNLNGLRQENKNESYDLPTEIFTDEM